jgi:hypothetical protein
VIISGDSFFAVNFCPSSLTYASPPHMAKIMGPGWKIAAVCLRLWELICAIVVCGFIGRYMNYLSAANVGFDSTVEFAMAMAAISIFASIVLHDQPSTISGLFRSMRVCSFVGSLCSVVSWR